MSFRRQSARSKEYNEISAMSPEQVAVAFANQQVAAINQRLKLLHSRFSFHFFSIRNLVRAKQEPLLALDGRESDLLDESLRDELEEARIVLGAIFNLKNIQIRIKTRQISADLPSEIATALKTADRILTDRHHFANL